MVHRTKRRRRKMIEATPEEAQAHYDACVAALVRMGNDLNQQHLQGTLGEIQKASPMMNFKCGHCNTFDVGVVLFDKASAMICRKCGKVELVQTEETVAPGGNT